MRYQYKKDDFINIDKDTSVSVLDLIKNKQIFELIRKNFEFDDEVLKMAHITKIVSNVKFVNEFVEHVPEKKKTYSKDTENLKTILKSLNTLEKQTEETFSTENKKEFSEDVTENEDE
jgi:mevalonate kinase